MWVHFPDRSKEEGVGSKAELYPLNSSIMFLAKQTCALALLIWMG